MEDNVMTLLKKGEKGLKSIIFSRMIIIIILFIINLLILLSIFGWFSNFIPHIFGTTVVFTVIMIIYLINSNMNSSAKITWLILILVMPVFGSLFYFYSLSEQYVLQPVQEAFYHLQTFPLNYHRIMLHT